MDTAALPREQLSKFEYEPPTLDQKNARYAGRVIKGFDRIKVLEPEHRQAALKFQVHFWGARGVKVSFDDDQPRMASMASDIPDEFSISKHFGIIADAEKAVGSPRVWCALVCQVNDTLKPQDIGHKWAAIKGRQQAKGYGEALIIAGLDTLCIHWGLVSKPPDRY